MTVPFAFAPEISGIFGGMESAQEFELFLVIRYLKVLNFWSIFMISLLSYSAPFVILRHESSEWLESCIESDFGMRFPIRSLYLAFHDFAFFEHSF